MSTEVHFPDSYARAREAFLEACRSAAAVLQSYVNPWGCGVGGEELACDVAWFGPPHAKRVLLSISGTHGLEGYFGSAIQTAWARRHATDELPRDVAVMHVHAINPWGFSFHCRTTEENVDLNRNFVDHDNPHPANDLYVELHPLLCPEHWTEHTLGDIRGRLDALSARLGATAVIDAQVRGQYTHPDGLMFGGQRPTWSNLTLRSLIAKFLPGIEEVAIIDLHTGLGDPEQMLFLCFDAPRSAACERAAEWWGEDNLRGRDAQAFGGASRPQYQGLLLQGIRAALGSVPSAGAVVEYGTVGFEGINGILSIERWLRMAARPDDPMRPVLEQRIKEAFCPRSRRWRQSAVENGLQVLNQALQGLGRPGLSRR